MSALCKRGVVAVTMRVVKADGYEEPRDAISHDWIRFLEHHGLDFVLVPNSIDDPVQFCRSKNVSSILLTNGENVGECSAHDKTEIALLEYAAIEKIRTLGVCRGMQLMNVYFGGKIVDVAGHVAVRHEIPLCTKDILDSWKIKKLNINSYHKQGVTSENMAPPLKSFAVSDDSVVEGLLHKKLPMIGLQWHPEREPLLDPLNGKILKTWLGDFK